MSKISPLYLFAVVVGIVAIYAGLSGKKLMIITNARTAVIALTVAGALMCTAGSGVGAFVSRAPAHPLSIAGYLLGILALLAGAVQAFKLQVPYLSNAHTALVVVMVTIVLKVVIARLQFLLPS